MNEIISPDNDGQDYLTLERWENAEPYGLLWVEEQASLMNAGILLGARELRQLALRALTIAEELENDE